MNHGRSALEMSCCSLLLFTQHRLINRYQMKTVLCVWYSLSNSRFLSPQTFWPVTGGKTKEKHFLNKCSLNNPALYLFIIIVVDSMLTCHPTTYLPCSTDAGCGQRLHRLKTFNQRVQINHWHFAHAFSIILLKLYHYSRGVATAHSSIYSIW